MPYAANGKIAQDQFDGAVKITGAQYAQGLEGMCAGLVVTIDGGFKVALPVAPEQEVAPKPSIEQLTMIALAERDRLLALAAIRIAPLQDAVDLKRETPDVLARLKQWKEYRVDLNEVQLQDDFPAAINWPLAPQE